LGWLIALKANTILVMCPSHITKKWAREVLLTIPRARTFLVEDMRNGGHIAHSDIEGFYSVVYERPPQARIHPETPALAMPRGLDVHLQ
jgi:hypothetical protein